MMKALDNIRVKRSTKPHERTRSFSFVLFRVFSWIVPFSSGLKPL